MQRTIDFISATAWLSTALNVVLIVFITWVISTLFKKWFFKFESNNKLLHRKFIYNIVIAVIYIMGTMSAVSQIPQLDKLAQTVLAGSGIVALAVSLSAQESLSNIVSGVFMVLFKPFDVGDRIVLSGLGVTGTVEDITLRHTIIKTNMNSRVVIPNSTINKEVIENSNLNDTKASSFMDVEVAYESDIDLAMKLMAEIVGEHPLYVDVRTEEEKETKEKVEVQVRALGASGIALRAKVWTETVNDNFKACSDIRLQLKKTYDEHGIEIPYTKYTILKQE